MGKKPGYILFIEGEFRSNREFLKSRDAVGQFQKFMGVKIQIDPVPVESI